MKPAIRICMYLLVSFAITGCADVGVSKIERIKANQTIASPIIQAITLYQDDHKQFPANLISLVPNYLSGLPKTTMGHNFDYRIDPSSGYTLCFYDGRGCCYQHTFQIWDCSGEAPED